MPLYEPGWVAGGPLVKQSHRVERGGRFICEAAVRFWPKTLSPSHGSPPLGQVNYPRASMA